MFSKCGQVSDEMKILHAGNMANVGYLTTKFLRNNGIDADLLIDTKHTHPETYDPELKNGYPDWFIQYHLNKPLWKLKVLNTMRKKEYDLIHAYVELPIFAYLSGKKFLVQALGSDFRELAQLRSLRGYLLRRAYKKAKVILFSMPDHLPIYSKFGLKNGIFSPLPVNSSFFRPEQIKIKKFENFFSILHPTNLEWRLKKNNILIEGFAKFVKKYPSSILIIIDRGIDSEKTHELIKNLDITEKICFIKGPLNVTELRKYYNLVDAVADSFLFPALSGITNEALCCEKPVITYYPEEEFKGVYPEQPPILHASNPMEVYHQLEILNDEKKRKELGKKSREWVTKNNDPEFYSKKLKIIYESIINNDNIEKIREKLSQKPL